MDKIHRYGKYGNSDYESNESMHYELGHGVHYYYSDESRSKKSKKKRFQKTPNAQHSKNTCDSKKLETKKMRRRLILIMQIVTIFREQKDFQSILNKKTNTSNKKYHIKLISGM